MNEVTNRSNPPSARRARGIFALALLAGAAGCGGSPKSTVPLFPAHGRVSLDGSPLADATIGFIPLAENQGLGGGALTKADGTYSATTSFGEPGLPAGEYRVVITKRPGPRQSGDAVSGDGAPVMIADAGVSDAIPAAYSDRVDSELRATVASSGDKSIDFELNSKAQKKPSSDSKPTAAAVPGSSRGGAKGAAAPRGAGAARPAGVPKGRP
jgi:hypothetical protein